MMNFNSPTLSQLLNDLRRSVDARSAERRGRKLKQNEVLSYARLHKKTGMSVSAIAALMDGTTSNPRPRNLEKLIAVFIEEGVLNDVAVAKEIWQEAGLAAQFSDTWFQEMLARAKERKAPSLDSERDSERDLQRMLVKTLRDITLLDAVDSVGLIDIENRDDDARSLPPREFYKKAKHEIVITGITAHTTIVKHDDEIIEALEASIGVHILILYPDPKLVEEMEEREHLKIVTEIRSVIESIQLHKLDQLDNFEIKFMRKIPSFTGVMIDGDINHNGKTPRDHEGQIRVQPASVHGTQHRGVVLQFKKKIVSPNDAFDYFAEDMRKQWQKAISLKELIRENVL